VTGRTIHLHLKSAGDILDFVESRPSFAHTQQIDGTLLGFAAARTIMCMLLVIG
jgi:hypothetical protein